MSVFVAAAVLIAAVTHASWNAIAHGIKDQLVAFTLMAGGGAVIGLVLACFAPLPASGAWPYRGHSPRNARRRPVRPVRMPPSTGSVTPVIQDASREARNATAAAMSSGWPTRPRG